MINLLRQGADVWNQWRQSNPETKIDFSQANLSEADLNKVNLKGANLDQANFRGAKLNGANLIGASLSKADFYKASLYMVKLSRAKLDEAILIKANIQKADLSMASFIKANLNEANLFASDLRRANFREAKLNEASLTAANLINADFSRAVLIKANLSRIQGLSTNFNEAIFTGACIEDWHINNYTNLDDVSCEYIYLKATQQERRPASGIFQPGDFTKLFEEVLDTVDLIFRNGVDWKAFVAALKKVQVENEGTSLEIQGIENKGDGVVIVKVKVPPDTDKEKIHQDFTQNYELALQAVEEKYKAVLAAKDEQIEDYRKQSADMMEIVKLQASRPISVEAKAVAGDNIHQSGQFGAGVIKDSTITGNAKVGGVINEAQQQNLAQAAEDIQKLLKQLEVSYPTDTYKGKVALADKVISEIDKDPSLAQRILSALRAGGVNALDSLLDNPAASFVIGALDDWQKSKGNRSC